MESEEEKVLPFYPSSLAEGERDDAERVLREAPTEPLARVRGRHGGPGCCRGGGGGAGDRLAGACIARGSPYCRGTGGRSPGTPAVPPAQAVLDYVGLEGFWRRFNKAKLEEVAAGQQRAALTHSNRRLRALLRRYLDGLAANADALSEADALPDVSNGSRVPKACLQRSRDAPQPHDPPARRGAVGHAVGLRAEPQSREGP